MMTSRVCVRFPLVQEDVKLVALLLTAVWDRFVIREQATSVLCWPSLVRVSNEL